MAALDVALAALAVLVVVRGTIRGARRESLDLLVLLLATLAAFRLSGAGSRMISSWSGAASLPARFIASGVIFIAVVVFGTYLTAVIARRIESDLSFVTRAVGGLLSLAWLTILSTIVLLVAVALPLNRTADGLLAASRATATMIDPASPSYQMILAFDRDRVLEAMVNLDSLLGEGRVVIEGSDRVEIPASTDIGQDRASAVAIFELLNLARVDVGLAPLAWSEALADVADQHAFDMYVGGYFAHMSPATGSVANRVIASGIPYTVIGENLALAPTVENVHEGLLLSPSHSANMLEPRFRRVGIGVYQGPLGLMVVQVFSG